MGKHRQPDILSRGAKFHRNHGLSDELRGMRAYHVNPNDSVCGLFSQHFHHAVLFATRDRTATGCQWEYTHAIIGACFDQILLIRTYPGHLRVGVDHSRHQIIINLWFFAGDQLSDHHAFLHALMGKHWSTHGITHGEDITDACVAVLIHDNLTPLGSSNPTAVSQQAICRRRPPNRDHQTVKDLNARVALLLKAHTDLFCLFPFHFGSSDPRAQSNIEPLFFKQFKCLFGYLCINCRQKVRQRLKDDHFSA